MVFHLLLTLTFVGAFLVAPTPCTRNRPLSLAGVSKKNGGSSDSESDHFISFSGNPIRTLASVALSIFLMGSSLGGPLLPAWAAESKLVGEIKGSGLIFKDTLQIERFEDPKVKGVILYISNFDRPITEKLGGNFFSDPSYASVGCAKTGTVAIADNIVKGPQGEEVFEESRSLLFKTLRVQRVYDEDKNVMVYVSFNTRLDKNDDTNKSRFKSSICAVGLD